MSAPPGSSFTPGDVYDQAGRIPFLDSDLGWGKLNSESGFYYDTVNKRIVVDKVGTGVLLIGSPDLTYGILKVNSGYSGTEPVAWFHFNAADVNLSLRRNGAYPQLYAVTDNNGVYQPFILGEDIYIDGAARIKFGGTTSSYAMLKRSGAELHTRLADDSGYANTVSANIFSDRPTDSAVRGQAWRTGGSIRWYLYLQDVEGGGNDGSNLYLSSYDDSGNYLNTLLVFNRDLSEAIFPLITQFTSGLKVGSANYAASGGVRLPNNISVEWRNSTNNGDEFIKVNASNKLEISPDLALTKKITTYNNVDTAEMGVAPILSYVFMDAYDTSQAWANFTNASTAGMYRVSVYYKLNTVDVGVNTLHVDIRWNGGGQSYTGETLTLSGTSVYKQYTIVLYHTGGGSVQHQAVLTVNSGSADTYDAHLTIERLV